MSWFAEDYFNLSQPELGIVNVAEHIVVSDGECYVTRSAVSDRVWEKLTSAYQR